MINSCTYRNVFACEFLNETEKWWPFHRYHSRGSSRSNASSEHGSWVRHWSRKWLRNDRTWCWSSSSSRATWDAWSAHASEGSAGSCKSCLNETTEGENVHKFNSYCLRSEATLFSLSGLKVSSLGEARSLCYEDNLANILTWPTARGADEGSFFTVLGLVLSQTIGSLESFLALGAFVAPFVAVREQMVLQRRGITERFGAIRIRTGQRSFTWKQTER